MIDDWSLAGGKHCFHPNDAIEEEFASEDWHTYYGANVVETLRQMLIEDLGAGWFESDLHTYDESVARINKRFGVE